MHQKYGIIRIVTKLYSVESKNCTYLAVYFGGGMNQQNNKTYDLQFSNDKIITTTTIITKLMSMHCSINMYKLKLLYQYKLNNLTCHFMAMIFSTTKSVASKQNF